MNDLTRADGLILAAILILAPILTACGRGDRGGRSWFDIPRSGTVKAAGRVTPDTERPATPNPARPVQTARGVRRLTKWVRS
jgi:hypothetical protein